MPWLASFDVNRKGYQLAALAALQSLSLSGLWMFQQIIRPILCDFPPVREIVRTAQRVDLGRRGCGRRIARGIGAVHCLIAPLDHHGIRDARKALGFERQGAAEAALDVLVEGLLPPVVRRASPEDHHGQEDRCEPEGLRRHWYLTYGVCACRNSVTLAAAPSSGEFHCSISFAFGAQAAIALDMACG